MALYEKGKTGEGADQQSKEDEGSSASFPPHSSEGSAELLLTVALPPVSH